MIHARLWPIAWRELKTITRGIPSLVSLFVVPVLFLAMFVSRLSSQVQTIQFLGRQVDYLSFVFPGMLGMQSVVDMSLTIAGLSRDRTGNLFGLILCSRVRLSDYFWGKYVAVAALSGLRTLVLFATGVVLLRVNVVLSVGNAIVLTLASLLGSFVFYAAAFLISELFKGELITQLLMGLLPMLLIYSSNSYYTQEAGAEVYRGLSVVNPLVYVVDLLRAACLVRLDFAYVWPHFRALAAIAALLFGLSMAFRNRLDR